MIKQAIRSASYGGIGAVAKKIIDKRKRKAVKNVKGTIKDYGRMIKSEIGARKLEAMAKTRRETRKRLGEKEYQLRKKKLEYIKKFEESYKK